MNQGRQTFEQEARRDVTRVVPIDQTLVAGTGSADTVFTNQDGALFTIEYLTATNTDSSARTLTLHVIPDGGSIGATNRFLDTLSIAANTSVKIDEWLATKGGFMLRSNEVLKAFASVTNVINIAGWGTEYR